MARPSLSVPSSIRSALREHRSEALTVGGLVLFFMMVLAGTVGLRFDSALFPRIVGVFGLIMAIAVVAQFALGRFELADEDELVTAPARKRIVALCAPAFYGVIFYFFGFYISAGIAIGAVPWLLGFRKPRTLLALMAGTILGLHALFSTALDVPIPLGIFGEWFMRRFVYMD